MGYYTSHSLEIYDSNLNDTINEETKLLIIYDLRITLEDAHIGLDENGYTTYPVKWYDIEEEMCLFSLKYPNIIFEFHCIGDEYDDIYKLYFKNGKYQYSKCHFNYDEYDENKLKEYGPNKQ